MSIHSWLRRGKSFLYRQVKPILTWLSAFGFRPLDLLTAVREFLLILRDYKTLKGQNAKSEHPWDLRFSYPCFGGKKISSGTASGAYFHQDLLVARRIFERKPMRHVDVGSRIDGFVAHVAVYREIEVLDIRPQDTRLQNVVFKQCDLMALPQSFSNYCDSLSCLHALEHFGLGRYGDELDIRGHLRGFESLVQMVQPDGILYLSLPIGKERIEFNAHRVFDVKTVLGWAGARLELMQFSYVDDAGDLHENIELHSAEVDRSIDLDLGCGIFEFRRLH
jgi:hypothetical protein